VPSPAGGVKRFKRYTRPIEVTITAAAAQRIRTFGGQTLAGYLSEQLGLPIAQTAVRARLHLFESMRGARLEHLALHANGVAGLGSARAASVAAFHPLTCTAAGLLIPKDVGLCRDVPDRFLTDRRRIAARQRFYVVEVPGARIGVVTDRRTDAGAQRARVRPQRPGSTAVTFDLRRHQVVVRQFLSERRAQEIAEALRRRATTSTIGALLRRDLPLELRAVLSGRPTPHLRLVREAPLDSETPRSIASALRLGGAPLVRSFVQSLGHRVLKRLAQTSGDFEQRFRDAAEHGADGVTVVMTMEAHRLFDVLRGSLTDIRRRLAAGRGGLFGDLTLDVRPGFRR
jgi:hypothetical protein